MKRPDFQEKTEVKVIDRGHHLYSKRGVVTAINGFDDDMRIVSKPYSPENYPTKWEVLVMFHDGGWVKEFWDWENQLEPVQKKDDLVIGKNEIPWSKSDNIGTPVYVVNTPRGAALYKRIERIYEERMKRNEELEKRHLKRYSTDPEYKRIIDNINEIKYHPQPKNKLLAWLESIIILSIILSPIAITACAYFLVDFFLNH